MGSGYSGKMLSKKSVDNAIGALDWKRLCKIIEEQKGKGDIVSELCSHIQMHSDIIQRYPNKKLNKKRDMFFNELKNYFRSKYGIKSEQSIQREYELIKLIERGYHSIVNVLSQCAIENHNPQIRISAYIQRMCDEHNILSDKIKDKYHNKNMFASTDPFVETHYGSEVDASSVCEGFSKIIATTLIMESYKNNFFNNDDIVVLPKLVDIDEKICFQAGSTFFLASSWAGWERLEKKKRFLGGSFQKNNTEKDNKEIEYIEFIPSMSALKIDLYDLIAHSRMKEQFFQIFFSQHVSKFDLDNHSGIELGAPLPPEGYVTLGEKAALVSLEDILGYSILEDQEQPAGIRLLEWIRGYAILKEIANSSFNKNGFLTTIMTESKLLKIFKSCGISRKKAKKFFSLISLQKSSRDMHDYPLIQIEGEKYLIYGPTLLDMNIALVVLSNLSTHRIDLSRKGQAFEQVVHDMFGLIHMETFHFKAHRNGEEFEYDVILPFEDYLFVFECKNRSLSGRDPVSMYYFDQEMHASIKQVKRLASALEKHPDIIEEYMGIKHVGKKIIPCILNCLPYSRGNVDGVYVTDYSVITRFFVAPSIYFGIAGNKNGHANVEEISVKHLWDEGKPTAASLIRQLERPIQFIVNFAHLKTQDIPISLSQTMYASYRNIYIGEKTPESICEALDADQTEVLKRWYSDENPEYKKS